MYKGMGVELAWLHREPGTKIAKVKVNKKSQEASLRAHHPTRVVELSRQGLSHDYSLLLASLSQSLSFSICLSVCLPPPGGGR
jgi:hypothetical protein